MENKNQETLEMKVLATLDKALSKMADMLNTSFDPEDPDSMKLLKEFRATMNSRRSWIKSCGLNAGNEDSYNTTIKKAETSINNQSSLTSQKPVLMNKPAASNFDDKIFEGIKCKNNPQPQVDQKSGLIYR